MTPGDPVRIGLAGYGRGGRFFHAPGGHLAPAWRLDAARRSAARGEVVRLS